VCVPDPSGYTYAIELNAQIHTRSCLKYVIRLFPYDVITHQGIFQGLYFGVGQGLGALGGGLLMHRFGGQAMFAQASAITLAAWALCAAAAAAARAYEAADGPESAPGRAGIAERLGRLLGYRQRQPGVAPGALGKAAAGRLGYSQLKSKDSGPDLSLQRPDGWEPV
jgi:MFS family permease